MIAVLSPAKRLDEGAAIPGLPATTPALLDDAVALADVARKLTVEDLRDLMDVSERLAELNVARFAAFRAEHPPDEARQAVRTFAGEVYQGLDAATLTADELAFAQDHVAILSGLYGVLRPLDLVRPYRLEMGSSLANPRGRDLYAWWGPRIAEEVARRLDGHDDPTVVNLASEEYFSAVDRAALGGARVVTCVFQEVKDGRARVLGFFAKKARGRMARFLVQRRARRAEEAQAFDADGYRFVAEASSATSWVFRRPQPPPVR